MSSREDQAQKEPLLSGAAEEEAASRIFALGPGEGEALWGDGLLATIKANGEQSDGRSSLVEIFAPDGYGSGLHVHHREDEGFWILEGELTFYVGDQTLKAYPGSFLFGPKDVPHAFTVDSGACETVVRLFACGFGGRHQGNGRASTVTDSAAPAGGGTR